MLILVRMPELKAFKASYLLDAYFLDARPAMHTTGRWDTHLHNLLSRKLAAEAEVSVNIYNYVVNCACFGLAQNPVSIWLVRYDLIYLY